MRILYETRVRKTLDKSRRLWRFETHLLAYSKGSDSFDRQPHLDMIGRAEVCCSELEQFRFDHAEDITRDQASAAGRGVLGKIIDRHGPHTDWKDGHSYGVGTE